MKSLMARINRCIDELEKIIEREKMAKKKNRTIRDRPTLRPIKPGDEPRRQYGARSAEQPRSDDLDWIEFEEEINGIQIKNKG